MYLEEKPRSMNRKKSYLAICQYDQRQYPAPVLYDLSRFVHVRLTHNPKAMESIFT